MKKLFTALFLIVITLAAYAVPFHFINAAGTSSVQVSHTAPLPVITDTLSQGVIGSETITLAGTATQIGTLTTNTRKIVITCATESVEIGNAGLKTGGGYGERIAAFASREFSVSTTTPLIYVVDVATDTAVRITHLY